MTTPLILASSSPRRRHLLDKMGLAFDVKPADINEAPRRGERPHALVRRLAATKAVAVGQRHPAALVLGADTVVALGQMILGKPHDADHAKEMLQMLNGNRHEIYTGVALWSESRARGYVGVSVAHVTFRRLTLAEIDAYVKTGEPMDKAGAYAIQGGAGVWVERYDGDLETVIGLPREMAMGLINRMGHESHAAD